MGVEPAVPRTAPSAELSGRPRVTAAVLCLCLGLLICAAALRWIDVRPSKGVPYWMVGLTGVVFLLAGAAIALPKRLSRWHDVIGALLFSAFAAMGLWIGFGPGERHFNGGISAGGLAVHGGAGISGGRIMFGSMGVLVLLMALLAWRRVFERRDAPGEAGKAEP